MCDSNNTESRIEAWLKEGAEFLEDAKRVDLMKRVLTTEIEREVRKHLITQFTRWWPYAAGLLLLLGITSYDTLASSINRTVKSHMDSVAEDARQKLLVTSEDMKTRAIVNAYALALYRRGVTRTTAFEQSALELSAEHTNRLCDALRAKETPLDLFVDILRVLMSCRAEAGSRGENEIVSTCRALLLGQDRELTWIRGAPEKRVLPGTLWVA